MSWKHTASRLGHRIAPRASLAFEIARHNRHFEPEFWLLPHLCDRKKNAVDVGGNAGLYAFYLSRLARKVHVFEPNPICLRQIARIKRRNMVIHELALSDQRGEAVMRFDPENTGIGTIEQMNRLDNNPGIRNIVERNVRICPLDDLGLDDIAFMKVDVEGHEPAVVRGAVQTLTAQKPVLLIEIERRHNATAFEEVEDILRPLGYSTWRLHAGKLIPVSSKDLDHLQILPVTEERAYINNFVFLPSHMSR